MPGYDVVVLALACCGWLPAPVQYMFFGRPEAVNEAALQPMKGRRVAVEVESEFSEAGMHDPAAQIADPLAASLAKRYGLQFEPGSAAGPDTLTLGMHTVEWRLVRGVKDYKVRYRGVATLVDRSNGRRLGRAWCDRNAPTGKDSYDDAMADRPALAGALHTAADACLQQLRDGLIALATPQ